MVSRLRSQSKALPSSLVTDRRNVEGESGAPLEAVQGHSPSCLFSGNDIRKYDRFRASEQRAFDSLRRNQSSAGYAVYRLHQGSVGAIQAIACSPSNSTMTLSHYLSCPWITPSPRAHLWSARFPLGVAHKLASLVSVSASLATSLALVSL